MIYVNKIENRVMFKITTRYYLELSTLEKMKLLVILLTMITRKIQESCINPFFINRLVNY